MIDVLLVAGGGALGAVARYLTDWVVAARLGRGFPWGTLLVNVVGSFMLGLIVGAAVDPSAALLLGTGFCGALTTYSTFAADAAALLTTGARLRAAAYAVASVSLGLLACVGGFSLAS